MSVVCCDLQIPVSYVSDNLRLYEPSTTVRSSSYATAKASCNVKNARLRDPADASFRLSSYLSHFQLEYSPVPSFTRFETEVTKDANAPAYSICESKFSY